MHTPRHAWRTSAHWRSLERCGMPRSSCARCASEYGSSGGAAQPGSRRHACRSRSTNSAIACTRPAPLLALLLALLLAVAFGGRLCATACFVIAAALVLPPIARTNASKPWPDFLERSKSPGGDTRHSRAEVRYW
eukprot:scaffold114277_cov72-Phaeocystis_antarctica.AAC.2